MYNSADTHKRSFFDKCWRGFLPTCLENKSSRLRTLPKKAIQSCSATGAESLRHIARQIVLHRVSGTPRTRGRKACPDRALTRWPDRSKIIPQSSVEDSSLSILCYSYCTGTFPSITHVAHNDRRQTFVPLHNAVLVVVVVVVVVVRFSAARKAHL